MKYEQELQKIKEVYGVDRWSRMTDLVKMEDNWNGSGAKALNTATMQMFMAFTERFGKVADDIALFLDEDGNLVINWSYFIDDPKKQRRGGLTRHVHLCFCPDGPELFLDEYRDQDAKLISIEDPEFIGVIEKYRTHRLPA